MNVALLSVDHNTLQGNLFLVCTRAQESRSRYEVTPRTETGGLVRRAPGRYHLPTTRCSVTTVAPPEEADEDEGLMQTCTHCPFIPPYPGTLTGGGTNFNVQTNLNACTNDP